MVHIAEDGTVVDHFGNPIGAPEGTDVAFQRAGEIGISFYLALEFLEGAIGTDATYILIFVFM